MEGLLLVLVLWAHRGFLTAIKLLLASLSVHDDSQGSDHVDSLALGSVPQILLTVSGTVAIDMFDLKISLRSLLGGLNFFRHDRLFKLKVAPAWRSGLSFFDHMMRLG